MNEAERRRHSLTAKIFRGTLLNCIILGVVILAVSLVLYTLASSREYVSAAYGVSKSAENPVARGADPKALADMVWEVYHSLTPEERAQTGTPEYRARFAHVEENVDYDTEWHILKGFLRSNDISSIRLGMFDRYSSALVYLADPADDLSKRKYPGEWESVDRKTMERFLSWDKKTDGMLYEIRHPKHVGWVCSAAYPVKTDEGELIGFIFTEVTLSGLIRSMRDFVLQLILVTLAITLLIALISARRSQNSLAKPLNSIANAARRYMADKTAGVEEGEHFASLDIHTGDELENLSLIMADMERELAEYETSLTTITAEKERIATELNMAANIQAHVLPNTFPPFPDRREFGIYATMTPAKEVGGDFYDFFLVDEDHLAMVMADVSGKGVPAALFMMTTRTMLKDAALSRLDPAAVLERVNARLCENNPDYMFVTVWLGILEISTGRLTWADAGHEKPFLYQDGAWKCLEKAGGVALAALEPELLELQESAPFSNSELTLHPGDVIFQYTDGVTEAMTGKREQFGMERLKWALDSMGGAKPEELLPRIREKLDAFVKDTPQFDDITMLAMQYYG